MRDAPSMNFRTRIVLGYVVLLVVTVAAVLIAVYGVLERDTLQQIDRNHQLEARELTYAPVTGTAAEREAAWVRHLTGAEEAFSFVLISPDDRVVYRSGELGDLLPEIRAGRLGRLAAGEPLGECWVTEHPLGGYKLVVISSLITPFSLIYDFEIIGTLVLALAACVSLLTGSWYARWLVRPLRRLEAAAERIDSGAAERIPADLAVGRDEVGRIARRLNAGYARKEASVDRIRFFSAEVSHEIRTPLSVIRLNAERIRDRAESPESVREAAGEQIEEILRLKRFVENLLGFAKLDSGLIRMDFRTIETRGWFSDLAEDLGALAEDAGRRFRLEFDAAPTAKFDPVWIRQVLFNLFDNAQRHSPSGGEMTLHVTGGGEAPLTLVFEDEGPGVDEAKLEEIFNRYTRFGEETGPADGVGLGLSICRAVTGLHRGAIRAENRRDRRGLRVTVTLPQDA